jgi:uncharacterized protein (TIGR00369 family)
VDVAALSGLAYLEHVRDGALPVDPLATLLGLRVVEVGPGRIVLAAEVGADHVNHGRIAHGGFLSTLMDLTCGLALHTTLPAGRSCPHAQASYRFLRPAPEGAELRCTGEVLHAGRTLGTTRCALTDAEGRLLATGEATHAYVSLGPAGPTA